MRKLLIKFVVIALLCQGLLVRAQVGIGTTTPSDAAMLEVSGGDATAGFRGLMPARVPSDIERDLIAPTATDNGLLVFVESTGCLNIWTGTNWENVYCIGGGSGASTLLGIQDFESTPGTPTLSFTGNGTVFTTADTNVLNPAVATFPSGNQAYGVNNGTATVDFGPVDASGSSSVDLIFNVASLSGNANNGSDQPDSVEVFISTCLLYTSPSPRDRTRSRMPSSA